MGRGQIQPALGAVGMSYSPTQPLWCEGGTRPPTPLC